MTPRPPIPSDGRGRRTPGRNDGPHLARRSPIRRDRDRHPPEEFPTFRAPRTSIRTTADRQPPQTSSQDRDAPWKNDTGIAATSRSGGSCPSLGGSIGAAPASPSPRRPPVSGSSPCWPCAVDRSRAAPSRASLAGSDRGAGLCQPPDRALEARQASTPPVQVLADGRLALDPAVTCDLDEATELAHRLIDGDATTPTIGVARLLLHDLLPDWAEDWLEVERTRFHQLRLHALDALCDRQAREQRYAAAVDTALAAIDADPYRESSRRCLVAAYLGEGNLRDAIDEVRTFERLLADELEAEPNECTPLDDPDGHRTHHIDGAFDAGSTLVAVPTLRVRLPHLRAGRPPPAGGERSMDPSATRIRARRWLAAITALTVAAVCWRSRPRRPRRTRPTTWS